MLTCARLPLPPADPDDPCDISTQEEIMRMKRATIVHKANRDFHSGKPRPAFRRVPRWLVDALADREWSYTSRVPLELRAWRRAARVEADRIRKMQDVETNRYEE